MNVAKIGYRKHFNLGNYESEEVWAEIEVPEMADAQKVMIALQDWVNLKGIAAGFNSDMINYLPDEPEHQAAQQGLAGLYPEDTDPKAEALEHELRNQEVIPDATSIDG